MNFLGVVLFEHDAGVMDTFDVVGFAEVDCFFAFASRLHPDFFYLFWHVFQDLFGDCGRDYEEDYVDFCVAVFDGFAGFYALNCLFFGVYWYDFIAGFFQVFCDLIAVFFRVV